MLNSKLYLNDLNKIHKVIKNVNDLNHKHIFITGATGLIGSALIDYLIYLVKFKKFDLRITIGVRHKEKAFKRFGRFIDKKYFDYVLFDATEPITLNGTYDYIVYAASPANPTVYSTSPVDTMLSNIIGLNSLLNYSRNNKVKKLVYVSSSEVYGIKSDLKPYRENEYGYLDILNDRACYPSSKRAAETLCISYSNQYDVDVSIVRPGHIYGPTATAQDSRASSQFFYDVIHGNDIVMKSRGEQMRSYCYVLDCVSSIVTVLLNGKNKCAYNISNPNSICSIYELACCIAKYANRKVVFESATEKEKKGYNLMSNSSLDSTLISELGWAGLFDINTCVEHTLKILKEVNQ